MKVRRSEVVLVDFPFSDRTGSKVRPALVVQDDRWNQTLDDTILALITSSPRRMTAALTQFQIDPTMPGGQGSGLMKISVVQCENLVVVDQRLIIKALGVLPARVLNDRRRRMPQSRARTEVIL